MRTHTAEIIDSLMLFTVFTIGFVGGGILSTYAGSQEKAELTKKLEETQALLQEYRETGDLMQKIEETQQLLKARIEDPDTPIIEDLQLD